MRRLNCVCLILGLLVGCQSETPPKDVAPTASTVSSQSSGKTSKIEKPATAPTASDKATPALEEPSADGHNRLTGEEISAGWVRLFDGATLFGWKANSDLNWRVEDGVIVADQGKPGLLVTTSPFADYELRCDYRLEKGGNSGIFLRTPFQPKDPAKDCYELNMADSHPKGFTTGGLVNRKKSDTSMAAEGEWKSFHVRVEGPKVSVKLNGEPVLEYTDDTEQPLKVGFIGLQMNGGKIEFRDVFLRPLSLEPLFNGKDLTGWRQVPGSESKFTVEDGTIRVTGGRGFLETERTADEFLLQFEAITHGEHLNSGIFFRAMPGTEKEPSNGYELQIQNGSKNGDRNQPEDFGTGAIFRRVPARRVVADDHQWLTGTLVADGPHFAVWINGIQVTDWTDTRPDDPNPRKGRRLEAGHFSLQGHDPTTNLQFRNLRLADLPER